MVDGLCETYDILFSELTTFQIFDFCNVGDGFHLLLQLSLCNDVERQAEPCHDEQQEAATDVCSSHLYIIYGLLAVKIGSLCGNSKLFFHYDGS